LNVAELIREHEGRHVVPYLDSLGIITWGIGRNVQDVPFSGDELALISPLVDLMFENDLRRARHDLVDNFPWFLGLDEVRQAACIDLRFNLGPTRFRGFVKFLAAMHRGDYERAADELVDSRWYTQVGRRGPRIVFMVKNGEWPDGSIRS
jgi:lysozyme